MSWKDGGELYLPTLNAAEDRYAIPKDLLARMAFQECSWRTEVIDYSVKSAAGAIGIMQLIPRFFPSAGISWQSDVNIAGGEVARLHDVFEDWQLVIAAYDWGQGNVEKYKSDPSMGLPPETSDYVLDVVADVPVQGAILNT